MSERRYQIVPVRMGTRGKAHKAVTEIEYILYDSACAWERLMASKNENVVKKERRRLERGDW